MGYYDLTLDIGAKVLDRWEARQFRRDILLSMALAQCGLAGEAFEGKDQVDPAQCQHYVT